MARTLEKRSPAANAAATAAPNAAPLATYAGGEWVRLFAVGLLTGVYVALASIPLVTLFAAGAAGRQFITGAVLEQHGVSPVNFLRAFRIQLRRSWRGAIASLLSVTLLVLYALLLASPALDLPIKAASAAGLVLILAILATYAIFADHGNAPWSMWLGWAKQLFFRPAQGVLLLMAVASAAAIGALAPALTPFVWGLVLFGCAVIRHECDALPG